MYAAVGRNVQNHYLHSIVDPEHAPLKGIPDKFSKLTTCFKPILNQDLFYPLEDVATAVPAGTFLATFDPYLLFPVHVLEVVNTQNLGAWRAEVRWTTGMKYGGIRAVEDETSRDLNLVTSEFRNMVGLVQYNNSGDDVFMFKAAPGDYPSAVGSFYGVPGLGCGYTSTDMYGYITLTFAQTTVALQTFTLRIVDRDQIIATRTVVGNGTTSVTFGDPFNGITGDLGMPGIGFQINVVDNTVLPGDRKTTMNCTSFTISAFVGYEDVDSGGLNPVYMRGYKYPDQETMEEKLSQLRFIGAMLQITFQGSAFNAGKIAALSYEGGKDWGTESLYSYNNISQKRNSYSKNINDGSYSFWKPPDYSLLNWQSTNQDINPEYPFLVVGGIITQASGTLSFGNLRLKQVSQIEAISDAQIFDYNYSPVDEVMLDETAQLISMLPSSMENPLHLEKIKEFFRDVGRTIVQGGQFLYNNRDIILPIAKNLALAAGMVL